MDVFYWIPHKNIHLNFSLFLCHICISIGEYCSSRSSDYIFLSRCHKMLKIHSVYFENKNLITTCKRNCCSQWCSVLNVTIKNENRIIMAVLTNCHSACSNLPGNACLTLTTVYLCIIDLAQHKILNIVMSAAIQSVCDRLLYGWCLMLLQASIFHINVFICQVWMA